MKVEYLRKAMSSHLPTKRHIAIPRSLPRWQDNLPAPHVKNFNPIVIVYRRPMFMTDHLISMAGGGQFTHCEMYIPGEKATFAIFVGGEMQCSTALPNFYQTRPDDFAWHMIILTDSEINLMERWHIDMVGKKCHYNFKDLMWKMTPPLIQSRCVSDLTNEMSHSPNKMFCSQAVILALREAFSGPTTKPIHKEFTTSVNSRITTPTELSSHCTKKLHQVVNTTPVPLTFWDARKKFLEDTPYGFSIDDFPGIVNLEPKVCTD